MFPLIQTIIILLIIITLLTLITKKNPPITTLAPSSLKVNTPSDIKKAIINKLIYPAKLISASQIIFYNQLKNIKKSLISYGFPGYNVDERIKRTIKMFAYKILCNAPPDKNIFIKLFLPQPSETLLHSLERADAGIGLHVNPHKTEYTCFNQTDGISKLNGSSLQLVDILPT